MTKAKENKEITEGIWLLEHGQYRDVKEYLKEMAKSESHSVVIGNFEYMQVVWCWVVWKSTDMEKDPQYKGEPLCKVVPRWIDKKKIGTILNAQAWKYI